MSDKKQETKSDPKSEVAPAKMEDYGAKQAAKQAESKPESKPAPAAESKSEAAKPAEDPRDKLIAEMSLRLERLERAHVEATNLNRSLAGSHEQSELESLRAKKAELESAELRAQVETLKAQIANADPTAKAKAKQAAFQARRASDREQRERWFADGPMQFAVEHRDASGKSVNQPKTVGASSEGEAVQKYREYMGIRKSAHNVTAQLVSGTPAA